MDLKHISMKNSLMPIWTETKLTALDYANTNYCCLPWDILPGRWEYSLASNRDRWCRVHAGTRKPGRSEQRRTPCQTRYITSNISLHSTALPITSVPCSRIRILRFFRFQKTWFLMFFLKWRFKSRKKSQKVSSLQFAECLSKFWPQNSRTLWVLIGIYHTPFSVA